MPITNANRRQLDSQGTALTGVWGGPQKQRYYTPSGDEIYAIPAIREWVQKDDRGAVVSQGTRDSNLDKGWLLAPPTVLQLHCRGCDKWHDAQAEVDKCIEEKERVARQWETRARKQYRSGARNDPADEVVALASQVEELKAMVSQLLGAKESNGS
jgi:hypothetical protein